MFNLLLCAFVRPRCPHLAHLLDMSMYPQRHAVISFKDNFLYLSDDLWYFVRDIILSLSISSRGGGARARGIITKG